MTNNKQQTAVELFAERTFNLIELMKRKWVNQEEFLDGMLKARDEAKEMEKEQHRVTAQDFYYASHSFKNFEQYYNETYGDDKQ
jgi:hypothetical protein